MPSPTCSAVIDDAIADPECPDCAGEGEHLLDASGDHATRCRTCGGTGTVEHVPVAPAGGFSSFGHALVSSWICRECDGEGCAACDDTGFSK
jgi:hypothetical protein